MNEAPHILQSKLQPPLPRVPGLDRSLLLQKLDSAAVFPVVLLQAPAGYGKSNLLSQWVHGSPSNKLWISLDPEDDHTELLLALLIASLQQSLPALNQESLGLLKAGARIEAALSILINEISAIPPTQLIVDDVQYLSPKGALPILAFLVQHTPPNLHIVLSSRSRPSLPLERWMANGRLVEISAQDLKVSEQEARNFLTDSMHLDLEGHHYKRLHTNTEGWLAGLQLAAIALKKQRDQQGLNEDQDFLEAYRGENENIFAYFASEVFEDQSPAVQHFLLSTSIPKRFDLELAQALSEIEDLPALIKALQSAGLFLISLDSESRWFRYHHLMRDFLQAEFVKRQPEELKSVREICARHLLAQGDLASAINLALQARAFDWLARTLESNADTMFTVREMGILYSTLNELPQMTINRHPRLLLFQAWSAIMLGQLDLVDAEIETLRINVQRSENSELIGILAVIEATLAVQKGRPEAISHYRDAEELLPKSALNWLGAVFIGLTMANYLGSGDLRSAEVAGKQSIKINQQAQNDFGLHYSAFYLGLIQIEMGQLNSAESSLQHSLELAQPTPDRLSLQSAWAYLGLGYCAWLRGQKDPASKWLLQALSLGKQANNKEIVVRASLILAHLSARSKNWEQMDELIAQAEKVALQSGIPDMHPALEREKLILNSLAKRQALLPEIDQPAQALPAYLDQTPLLRAQKKLIEKEFTEAEEISRKFMDQLPESAILARIQGLLLLAQIPNSADESLSAALDLGLASGIQTPFITAADWLPSRLENMPSPHPFAQQIQWTAFDQSAKIRSALIEPLSRAEEEILSLMEAGLSNQQLAEKRHVSLNTIKWHLKNIYGKLAVSNRTAAIHRAKELDLI